MQVEEVVAGVLQLALALRDGRQPNGLDALDAERLNDRLPAFHAGQSIGAGNDGHASTAGTARRLWEDPATPREAVWQRRRGRRHKGELGLSGRIAGLDAGGDQLG